MCGPQTSPESTLRPLFGSRKTVSACHTEDRKPYRNRLTAAQSLTVGLVRSRKGHVMIDMLGELFKGLVRFVVELVGQVLLGSITSPTAKEVTDDAEPR